MILKNLGLFIKNNKMLFTLLIITQITAVSIILFSFGIYRNNRYKLAETESEDYSFEVNCITDEEGSRIILFSEVRDKLPEVMNKHKDLIESMYVSGRGNLDGEDKEELLGYVEHYLWEQGLVDIEASFTITEEGFDYGFYNQNMLDKLDGRDFTREELNSDKPVTIVNSTLYMVHSDYWTVNGITYEVIGNEHYDSDNMTTRSSWLGMRMPYYAMPEDMQFKRIYLSLTRPLLRSEYEEIKADFMAFMDPGSTRYSDFYGVEIDEKATMKTMMFTSVFMSLISAFSVCLIYRYMLTKRIKTTAVYRICGCSATRSALIYIGEMLAVLAGSCLIGSIIFTWLAEPQLQKRYTWFAVIFQSNACYLLVLMYFVIVALITTIMIAVSCRKTPKEMLRNKIH